MGQKQCIQLVCHSEKGSIKTFNLPLCLSRSTVGGLMLKNQKIKVFCITFHESISTVLACNMLMWRLPSGNQSSLPLPRPVGWQLFHGRRTAAPHLPAVPHLRPLHALRFHPGTSLLRQASGFPSPLSPGGQRPWQVRQPWMSVVYVQDRIIH